MTARLVRQRGVPAMLVRRKRTTDPITGREAVSVVKETPVRAIIDTSTWTEDARPDGQVRTRTFARLVTADVEDVEDGEDVALVFVGRSYKVVHIHPADRTGTVRLDLSYDV